MQTILEYLDIMGNRLSNERDLELSNLQDLYKGKAASRDTAIRNILQNYLDKSNVTRNMQIVIGNIIRQLR